MLWATHLVDEVHAGDALTILHQGRVLADGRTEAICAGRPLAEVFLDLTADAPARPEPAAAAR